jgi:chromosome segregation ATPase
MSNPQEYFRQREEDLMKLNAKLDEQKVKLLIDSENQPISEAKQRIVLTGQEGALESLQATVKYQKARIAALQEELDRLHREGNEKEAEMASLRVAVRETTEEIKKLMKKLQTQEGEYDKTTKKKENLETKIKILEDEHSVLNKEKEQEANNVRKLEGVVRTNEVKMNRVLEENERLRTTVKEMKSNDKEKGNKDEVEKLQNDVKRLTKQRAELIGAFKKQAKLVDVLKKMKTHIEASRLLNFTEEEFLKITSAV